MWIARLPYNKKKKITSSKIKEKIIYDVSLCWKRFLKLNYHGLT
jgi:hypothetical protein